MKKIYQNAKRLFLLAVSFMMLGYAHGQIVVTGTVIDGINGGGLPGATVVVQGTKTGTATDIDGKFSIKVPDKSAVIEFSMVGYAKQSIKVGEKTVIDITLKADVKQIDEIKVMGYGVQKSKDVTGSTAQISGSDLADRPVIAVDQAMQGKAAGVAVTSNSGAPGADAMVRIRGTGSINSSDPLYVVDGIPQDGTPKVNPTDIKSISVLKDASACAIYGSRAANGVVLITLKEGKMGNKKTGDCQSNSSSEISVDAYYGVQNAQKFVSVANAAEYVKLFRKSGNVPYSNIWNEHLDTTGSGTNWQKQVFRPAPIQRYTLTWETGADNSSSRISASWVDQQGMVKGSGYKALNLGGKVNHKLKNWLNVGETFGFTSSHKDIVDQSPNFYSNNPVLLALIMDPTVSASHDTAVNRNGSLSTNFNNGVYNTVRNPLRAIDINNQKDLNNSYSGSLFIDFTPIKDLVIRSQIGGYGYIDQYSNYTPTYEQIPGTSFNNLGDPVYELSTSRGWSYTLTNTATYNHSWMRRSDSTKIAHSLLVLVGNEEYYNKYDGIDITGYNMKSSLSSVYPHLTESDSLVANKYNVPSEVSMTSLFGRLNYAFHDKYLLTSNIRYDWCSRFVKGNRLGIFPSFSSGWKVSDEDWFKNNENFKNISEFKVRAGWGEIGNSTVQDAQGNFLSYPFASTMQQQFRSYSFNGVEVPGYSVANIPNPNLKWETSTQYNVGVDMSLLQNKVTCGVDAFYKQTYNMIVTLPVPLITGGEFGDSYSRSQPSIEENAGSVMNKGIEASLSYKGEIDMKQKLSYDIGGNIAYNDNIVGNIGGQTIAGTTLSSPISFAPNLTQQGYSIASFYGYKVEGIYQNWADVNSSPKALSGNAQPGDFKFQDTNGDGVINDKDKVFLGSPLPKLTYGFYLNGTLGHFDFNLSFQGTYGNKIFNATKYFLDGGDGTNNFSTDRLNAWDGENSSNTNPRLGKDATNFAVPSSAYVENGSYLRLKDVTIGFTLPPSIVKKIKVNKVRVYVQIQNALTFTKYSGFDPEIGQLGTSNGSSAHNNTCLGVDLGTYPQARTFIGGVNFTF